MQEIKWGIIGTGKIANALAHALSVAEGTSVQAVASRQVEKAKRFSEQYNIPAYFGSYEALAQAPDIDVVYVATPHVYHYENTMMCLNAGKAVLCEKPFGMNAKQVKQMTDLAKQKQLFLMEAMWTRFIPATEKMLALIAEGRIGNVQDVRADFGFPAAFDPESRLFNKHLGGGALLDIGIYPVYLSFLLQGMPKEIKTSVRMSKTGVDSFIGMLFEFENGNAVLDANLEALTPTEAFIYGTKGFIKLHSRFHHSMKISLQEYGKQEEVYDLPYDKSGYYFEVLEVVDCLRKGWVESPKLTHQNSFELISILDRVRESIGLRYESDESYKL